MDSNSRKVVLVTGSTGGIGIALCKALCEAGYRVVGNCRCPEKGAALQNELAEMSHELDIAIGDVGDYESVGRMIRSIEESIGPVDILINNAGVTKDKKFTKMSKDDWDYVINTDLNSVFHCSRHVIDGMIERKFGRIVNISSINAQKGQFGQTNYSAAKAGIHGFTKSLALEVAKYGVTVNTVSPGYIGTNMVMAVAEDIREKIVAQIPVGRLGYIEEVADAVSYLLSDKASFITGSNLSINGGHHMY
ncbi:acetoacetyl-CoA reductase [Dyadobacter flavalbus]|uniref:Acetoacetyl-CoA reductase n=1 Tax=Dyadobacter flavalbus TaxID=2579942 RepID=A0A5M8QE18_9BACT|nr:acetoacetyl-CoA reductase [Dyadobacter flavalbus]KAA6432652.1 acetoacetyl-CoA reductase [Dyadobacter flavalbus]